MAAPESRIPPGQRVTLKWPVLHYGAVPQAQLDRWDFRIFGLVEKPVRWTRAELMALPQTRIVSDIHCVTRWSKLDMDFEGVSVRELLKHVKLNPAARFAMIHCEQGFTTNLALADLLGGDVILAHKAYGEDLTPEHGWPLRLVVPHLYFWKSAKWARGIEFRAEDSPGFWEQNGYHMRGDPWQEERLRGES
ncbi:MAG: sulfite oxidase-like oxidoreductase [Symbiobacteriia bacterium]